MSHILPEKLFHSVSLTGSSVNFFHSQHFNYVLLIFLAYMVLKRKARCNFCLFFPFWFLFGIFSLTLIFFLLGKVCLGAVSLLFILPVILWAPEDQPQARETVSKMLFLKWPSSSKDVIMPSLRSTTFCTHRDLHQNGGRGGQGFPGHCLIKKQQQQKPGGLCFLDVQCLHWTRICLDNS